MGFPLEINNYIVFEALSKGPSHPLYRKVESAMSPFKLFVFIIHNPKKNISFDQYLNSNFSVLDSASGRELLFFSIVNQNTFNVREFIQSKHFQFQYLKRETSEFFKNQNNVILKNEDSSSFLITKLLKINYENLPLMIVTNNLLSNRIVYLKTSEKYILEQLAYLGNISRFLKYQPILSYLEIKEIDLINTSGEVVLKKKLSDYLSYFYSTATYLPFENKIWEDDARKTSFNILNSIKTEITDSKIILDKKYEDEFITNESKIFTNDFYENNLIYIIGLSLQSQKKEAIISFRDTKALYSLAPRRVKASLRYAKGKDESSNLTLARIQPPEIFPDYIHIKIDNEFLEDESMIILDTANAVTDIYQRKSKSELKLDHTPLIICLSKIFEIEINLSVVHWIRMKLKIHLPDFFNKVEPGVDAKLELSEDRQNSVIDFNRGTNQIWYSPGLGQSELSFKELKRDFKKYSFMRRFRFNPDILLKHWDIIRKKRNKAAHTGVLNVEDVKILQNSFVFLSNSNFFKKFYFMKSIYRGNP